MPFLDYLSFVYKMKDTSRESSAGDVPKFRASYGELGRFKFEASYDSHYSACMKHLREHPRGLTRARQLASRKRSFNVSFAVQ
jgi:hypothetical protein